MCGPGTIITEEQQRFAEAKDLHAWDAAQVQGTQAKQDDLMSTCLLRVLQASSLKVGQRHLGSSL